VNKNQIDTRLRQIRDGRYVFSSLPTAQITDQTTIDDLGFDSLDKIEFAMDVEDQFGINIPDTILARVENWGDLINTVHMALTT
jgi:acyl carrier protein